MALLLVTTQATASPAPRKFVLYATDAQTIRAVPLKSGHLPNLNKGRLVPVVIPPNCEDNITQPVTIVPLKTSGHFLTVWWNETQNLACYSHFAPDDSGCNGFVQIYSGRWIGDANSNRWSPVVPGVDLNADRVDEVALTHSLGIPDNFSDTFFLTIINNLVIINR